MEKPVRGVARERRAPLLFAALELWADAGAVAELAFQSKCRDARLVRPFLYRWLSV